MILCLCLSSNVWFQVSDFVCDLQENNIGEQDWES